MLPERTGEAGYCALAASSRNAASNARWETSGLEH
jgi:hypothetical protein